MDVKKQYALIRELLMYFPTLDSERIIHSFKTALACLIGFVITKSVEFPVDQWLIITIIVVMCAQISVGGVIQKSYMRFLGTLSGSLLAALTLYIGGNNTYAIATMVGLSAILFSYIATGQSRYNDAGTLGAVTVVIILISRQPTFLTAFERFTEISVGILIAALISQFLLPIHAREHLRELQATTIRQLRDFYVAVLMTHQTEHIDEVSQKLDEDIAQLLIKQRKLAIESIRERLGSHFDVKQFNQLLQIEKNILRSIAAMQREYYAFPLRKVFFAKQLLEDFHKTVCQTLSDIANVLGTHKKLKPDHAIPDIRLLKQDILFRSQTLPIDDVIKIHAFLFSAEELTAHIKQLIEKINHSR